MADSGAIRAGRAFVELFADSSKLDASLKNVRKNLDAFGKMIAGWGAAMMAAGAAITAPLIAAATITGQIGEQFSNMAARTGVSIEALTALNYVASQTGTDIDTVENGIRKMQKSLLDASEGLSTATDAFNALGLSVADLQGLSPEQQFRKIGDALNRITDPSMRAALAMEIFGRTGTALLPMFEMGSEGIDRLIARAKELGLVLSTADVQAAGAFNDKLAEMWLTVRAAAFAVGSILIPPLTTAINAGEKFVAMAANWIKANREVLVWTLAIGAAIAAAGAVLLGVGTAFIWAAAVIAAVGTVLAAVWTTISTIGAAIAAAVTSPLLITVGVIAGLGGAFLYMSGEAGKAIAWVGGQLGALKDFATEAFSGIASALVAGDIETAAKILWTSLQIAWQEGVHALESVWAAFKLGFLQAAYSMYYGAQSAFEEFTDTLEVAWIETVAVLKTVWATFSAWYHTAVEGLANWLAKRWVEIQAQFDSSIDVDQQEAYIDQDTSHAMQDIKQQESADKNKIENERKGGRQAEQALHDKNMAQIGDDYNQAAADAEEEYQQQQVQGADELAKLWQQFHSLTAQAKNEKTNGKPFGQLGAAPTPDDFAGTLGPAQKAVGTFSGAAAQGIFGGTSTLERHAQETAKNTATMAKIMTQQRNALGSMGIFS
ncbi:MAG TPA: hypothetical protein VHQ47_17930 [Phycisphaerae bacterium]|nr:hypothetical protein [Phycisphaerae bacterium]